jgi:hypothetical protein
MIGESGGGFSMSPFVLIINEPNFEEIKDATIRRHSWARIGLRSQAAKSFDAQPDQKPSGVHYSDFGKRLRRPSNASLPTWVQRWLMAALSWFDSL